MNNLLQNNPALSSNMQRWPTPSPDEWQAIQSVADIVFKAHAKAFETVKANVPQLWDFTELCLLLGDLDKLPYNLLAGHLSNLELDVTKLIK